MRYQWQTQKDAFAASWVIFIIAFGIEYFYRYFLKRDFKKSSLLDKNNI
jgi:hypothetical protein